MQQPAALVLGHAAPRTEHFLKDQGVFTALNCHWAVCTDLFCLLLSVSTRVAAFPVGVEEQGRILCAATSLQLPAPLVGAPVAFGWNVHEKRYSR
jgi:hypothetical protein